MRRLLLALAVLLAPGVGLAAGRAPDQARKLPPLGSERRLTGVLVTAEFIHRAGQFRQLGSGKLVDFVLAPYGSVRYLGAEADLRDVPLDTQCEFSLVSDGPGGAMQTALIECRAPASPQLTREQRKRFADFIKNRGLPAWIDSAQGNTLTITLFSGEPERFEQTWLGAFPVGTEKAIAVVVANDELRTWDPMSDKERCRVDNILDGPVGCFGSSGVRLVLTAPHMLEGFRRGRVVRVFGAGWTIQDQPFGESLMNTEYMPMNPEYGGRRFRARTAEVLELLPKEYPGQFPFRTDYGNAHLPWYRLQKGETPPRYSEHLVLGELAKVGVDGGSGQFRTDRTGVLVNFSLAPEAAVRYLNATATLDELPLGTRCRFHLYQDENGEFRTATLVSDEFSYMADNLVTFRVEKLLSSEGKLHVARQIPAATTHNLKVVPTPDIGRAELRVDKTTRLWKDDHEATLSDLAVGDVLLVNVTSEQPGAPSRCTDIWIGTDTHKLVTQRQSNKHAPAKKQGPAEE